ncbi:MAG: DMT family transporter [Candidatus Woesearchaeota archaeon]
MVNAGVLFGILGMIAWGVCDFLATKAIRKIGDFRAFFWVQLASLIPFVILVFLEPIFLPSFRSLIFLLIATLLTIVAYMCYYKGLHVGLVSIIAPIVACYSVITVVFSVILFKEVLTLLQVVAISLAVLGTIMVSFKYSDWKNLRFRKLAKGLNFALVAVIFWGIYFLFFNPLGAELGWFLPVFYIKIITIIYLGMYVVAARKKLAYKENVRAYLVSAGVLESVGFLAFSIGVYKFMTAVVTPITAASPAVSVVLAKVFFKEKLEWNQDLGLVLILAGLVALAM